MIILHVYIGHVHFSWEGALPDLKFTSMIGTCLFYLRGLLAVFSYSQVDTVILDTTRGCNWLFIELKQAAVTSLTDSFGLLVLPSPKVD